MFKVAAAPPRALLAYDVVQAPVRSVCWRVAVGPQKDLLQRLREAGL